MNRTYSSPSQIAFFEPLSWWVPFGFVIFLAVLGGIAFVWSHFQIPLDSPWAIGFALFILLIVGSQVLGLLGQGLKWFGRLGAVVDRQAGTVDTHWGILLTMPWDRRSLGEFSDLLIGKEITEITTRSGTRYEIEYQLFLVGGRGEPLMVGRDEHYGPVRVMAEELGRFLKFDVIDASGLGTETIPCDTLCQPAWVRDRAALAEYRGVPASSDVKYSTDGKTLHVTCPTNDHTGCLMFLLIPLGLLAWFLYYIFTDSKGDAWVPMLIIGGIGGFILLALTAAFLPNTPGAIASPEMLTLTDSGLFGTSRTEIPVETIWQVRTDYPGINILTSEGLHSLAVDATESQTEQLRIALLHFIAAGK